VELHQAVVTTRLGGIDRVAQYQPQSVPADYFVYDAPLRTESLHPRLQAKIPKYFAWQLYPGYDTYLWLDGNIRLKDHNALEYYYNKLEGYDVVVHHHPDRDTIWWEYRYNWRALHNNAPSNYMRKRYVNELLDEQMAVIKADKDYVDNYLVNGGVFMYRNTQEVQLMLKQWWHHVSRYLVMDQLSWAYVLRKSGLRVNVLHENLYDCPWVEVKRHAH
jgi:hypothetical protein